MATRISDVYVVTLPKAAQDVLSIFEVLNLNIAGLSLPLQCVGMGSYWQQMLFTIVFPLAVAAGIVLSAITHATCCAKGQHESSGTRDMLAAAASGHTSSLRASLLLVLPHLLMLSFLVFPMVRCRPPLLSRSKTQRSEHNISCVVRR